jgi:hypothetical protein
MAEFEDTIRKAVPGGNIAKPLMLALLALLASGALSGKRDAASPAGTGAQPPRAGGAPLRGYGA